METPKVEMPLRLGLNLAPLPEFARLGQRWPHAKPLVLTLTQSARGHER
jgi:hypothetical protein